jgi:hypothetical protein
MGCPKIIKRVKQILNESSHAEIRDLRKKQGDRKASK